MALTVSDVAPIRSEVEKRRNEWLAESENYTKNGARTPGKLEARLQELAWVLRLLDGLPA